MFSKLSGLVHQGERHDEPQPQSQEQSLTTILATHEERTQLLLLITACMESMRQQVVDIFDPDKTDNENVLHLRPTAAATGIKQSDEYHQEESVPAGRKSDDQKMVQLIENISKDRARRSQELSDSIMVSLKKASLDHFDTWSDRVIQRVGEVVNHPASSVPKSAGKTAASAIQHEHSSSRVDTADDHASALQKFSPPQPTTLRDLDQPRRVLILHSLLLLLLSLESYTAESRLLMLRLTSSLSLPLSVLVGDETRVAKGLLEAAKQQMNADQETKDKADASANSRKWKVGLGAAAGAVLIGVTGGLAAPLLAAGIGSVMGGIGLGATATAGYLGAMAGSAPLVGVLFGAYGGRMTGQMVDKYAKEVEDFAFIPVHKPSTAASFLHGNKPDTSTRHLRVAIGISGWLSEEAEVIQPWQILGDTSTSSNSGIEAFALRYELKALLNLGHALTTYIKSYAWGWAKKQIISRTIFAALSSALASAIALPYGMAKAAKIVDNPFQLAKSRSDKAGKVLADALIHKVQGERPVTLIGYSLGARVIFSCLTELADRRAFGLVESVVLIGSPSPSDSAPWRKIRSVVTGRVVNVFSANDYLLSFLYRTASLQLGIAGLQPILDVAGIENVDASDLVDGHLQYRHSIGSILLKIGLEDVDENAVAKQIERFKIEEQKAKEAAEAERKRQGVQAAGKDADDAAAEKEAREMETEVAQKNKASAAFDWVSQKVASLTTSPTSDRHDGGKKDILERNEKGAADGHAPA